MDKKNTIIGVALLIAGMVLMTKTSQRPEATEEPAPVEQAQQQPQPQGAEPTAPVAGAPAPTHSGHAQLEVNGEKMGEVIVPLENELAEFRFSNIGGSLKEIVLKDYKKTLHGEDPYVMNHDHYRYALNLSTNLGDAKDVVFARVPSIDANSVTFRAKLSDQLEVTRRYTISQSLEEAAPYTVVHTLEFRNLGDQPLPLGEPSLNIGTVAPSGSQDLQLQTFGYSNGEDVEFINQSKFVGGGFLFFKSSPQDIIQASDRIEWASVKNQFFITLLTPEEPSVGYLARPVEFRASEEGIPTTGLTADVRLAPITIAPGETVSKTVDFYSGPKIHGRLAKLERDQEKAMQFGFFGAISKFLLLIMNGLQSVVTNWGVSIILLTLVVRGALLPITLASMKSMKKMSKISEPMKAMKEKMPAETAEQKQKQQLMMMELYKLNKINPVAGCLPMLLQIPIFFALFYMLRSAAELRFADFLWIHDLSKPDTVAHVAGIPLNILPFFWIITLAYQMWTMPSPTMDNAQAKMMKFMPFVFFPFTYTFSSGLVLYWTVSNVFTIGQQWLAKRGQDDFEVILPPALKKILDGDDKKSRRKK